MSQVIDTRVVEMQFDNSNFNKNIASSKSALEKFNSTLNNMSGGTLFGGLTSSITAVSKGFTALEAVGINVLSNIASQAVSTGAQLVKSMSIDQISAGWEKYGENTKNTATLLAQGYDESEVESVLKKLLWFTDETSYSYTEMVNNISKFTAAGQGLEASEEAMEGIALWAAMAGQNATTASNAMYQLSQAVSAGYMQKNDWNSIITANMDTVAFRETLISAAEALGTLEKVSDGVWRTTELAYKNGMEVTVNNLVNTLTDARWATSDVMMAAFSSFSEVTDEIYDYYNENEVTTSEAIEALGDQLDQFSLTAFEAGQQARTFEDVIGSIKDAVSTGWMNVFTNIFGQTTEAIDWWTYWANALYEFFMAPTEALNSMLDIWRAHDGAFMLKKAIQISWETFLEIVQALADGFAEIFGTAEQHGPVLLRLTNGLLNGVRNIQTFVDEHYDAIVNIGAGIASVFDIIKQIVQYLLVEPLKAFFKNVIGEENSAIDGLSGIADLIQRISKSTKFKKFLTNVSSKLVTLATALGKVVNIILDFSDLVTAIENKDVEGFLSTIKDKAEDILDVIVELVAKILGFNDLNVSKIVDGFNSIYEKVAGFVTDGLIGNIVDIIRGVKQGIKDQDISAVIESVFGNSNEAIASLIDTVGELLGFDFTGFSTWVVTAFENIESVIGPVAEGLAAIVGSLGSIFVSGVEGAKETGSVAGFFSGIQNGVDGVLTVLIEKFKELTGIDLSGAQKNVQDFFQQVKDFVGGINGQSMLDGITAFFGGIKDAIVDWAKGLFGMDVDEEDAEQKTFFAIELFKKIQSSLEDTDPEQLRTKVTSFLTGVGGALGDGIKTVVEALKGVSADDIVKVLTVVEMIVSDITVMLTAYFTLKLEQQTVKMIKSVNNILPAFGDMCSSISGTFSAVTKSIKGSPLTMLQQIGIFLLEFAALVAVVAYSIRAVKDVSTEKIITMGIIYGVLMGEVIAIIAVLGTYVKQASKNAFTSMDLKYLQKTLTSIALVMLSIAASLYVVGQLSIEKMTEAGMVIGIMAAVIIYAMKSLTNATIDQKKLKNAAESLLIATASFAVIAIAVDAIAWIDPTTLGTVFAGLFIMFAEVAVALGVLSSIKLGFNASGMQKIASAVVIASAAFVVIALAINAIAWVDTKTLIGTVQALGVLFLEVSAAVFVLTKFAGSANDIMASAIAIVVAAAAFDLIAAGIAGIMLAMSSTGTDIKSLEVIALILAGSLAAILLAIVAFVGIGALVSKAGIIPELTAFAGACDLFALAVLGIGVGIGVATAGISALITSIATVIDSISNLLIVVRDLGDDAVPTFKNLATGVRLLIHAIASQIPYIGKMLGQAIVGFAEEIADGKEAIVTAIEAVLTAGIEAVGNAIPLVIDKIIEGTKELLIRTNELIPYLQEVVTNLILAILQIVIDCVPMLLEAVFTIIDNLATYIPLVTQRIIEMTLGILAATFEGLATGMPQLINSILDFFQAIIDSLADVADRLDVSKLEDAITGLIDIIIGLAGVALVGDLAIVGLVQIVKVLAAFSLILDAFATINAKFPYFSQIIDNAMPLLEKLVSALGTLLGDFTGAALSGFAEFISLSLIPIATLLDQFMTAMQPFLDKLGAIDNKVLSSSTILVKVITQLAKAEFISGVMGLMSIFTGGSLGFAVLLAELAAGLSAFNDSIIKNNVEVKTVKTAAEAAEILVNLIKKVAKINNLTNIFNGSIFSKQFGVALTYLGDGIAQFYTKTKDIKSDVLEAAANCGETLTALAETIPRRFGAVQWWNGGINTKAFGNGLTALGSGISDFYTETSDIKPDVVEAAANAGLALTALADTIPERWGVDQWINGGKAYLGEFGDSLYNLGHGIQQFYYETCGIELSQFNKGVDAAQSLSDFANTLPTTGGIVSWFTGDNSLATFGTNLQSFGSAIKLYNDTITADGGLDKDAIVESANAASSLATLACSIPESGGLWGEIVGGTQDLGKFGNSLSSFGEGISAYAEAVIGWKDADTKAVEKSSIAGTYLADMASHITSNETGILGIFTGWTNYKKFGNSLGSFGSGIKAYADNVVGMDTSGLENAAIAVSSLTTLMENETVANILQDGVFVSDTFAADIESIGDGIARFCRRVAGISNLVGVELAVSAMGTIAANISNMESMVELAQNITVADEFASKMGALANGVNAFANAVKNTSFTNVWSAISAISQFASINTTLKNSGNIYALEDFGTSLSTFSTTVGTFANSMAAIDSGALSTAIIYAHNLANMLAYISSLELDEACGFSVALNSVASTGIDEFINKFSTSELTAKTAATNFITAVKDALDAQKTSLHAKGFSLYSQFRSGFSGDTAQKSVYTGGTLIASKALTALTDYSATGAFYTAGQNAAQGYINGLNSKTAAAYYAAYKVGENSVTGLKKAIQAHSPSRAFMEVGGYAGEGYIIGLTDTMSLVRGASEQVGTESLNAMSQALAQASEEVNNDDVYPVITPVLDLSEIQNGMTNAQTMFNSSALAMRASSAYSAATPTTDTASSTSATSNLGATNSVVINVYGAEGQDVGELADIVADRINSSISRTKAVYA